MMITMTDKEAVIMKKSWGRQYRFLFFFTLIAGLILPLICMLNLVYLCFSRNFGDYDSQFYSLCIALRILPLMFDVAALSGVVVMSARYSFRATVIPMLFVITGVLIAKSYDPFMIFYSNLRYGLSYNFALFYGSPYYLQTFGVLMAPIMVYALCFLMKRLLKDREILSAFIGVLSWVLFNGMMAFVYYVMWKNWMNAIEWIIPNVSYIVQSSVVMLLTAAAILLIFHFKIPSDTLPTPPQMPPEKLAIDKRLNDEL